METRKWALVLLIGISLLFVRLSVAEEQNSAAGAKGDQKAARPLVILTGTDSQIKEQHCYLIRSEKEWVKIWFRHKGIKEPESYDRYYNPLSLPEINFDKCVVLAIFQGNGWNSAGLKVVDLLESKDRILLRFDEKSYQTMGSDLAGGANKVTVYGFFVMPRSDKTLIIEENVQNLLGQPPVWKQRAKFDAVRD